MNYFNKELSDLTVEEAAYLAALPKAPQQLPSVPPDQGRDRAAQLDHRPDGRERLHHGGRGRGRQEEAARHQHPPDGRTHLRRGVFRRGSTAHAAVDLRRGQALQRRPFGAHYARPEAAADRAPRADRRPRRLRPPEGLARTGRQDRHQRRLGCGPQQGRKPGRHPALAARHRVEDRADQGDRRPAAREAAGRHRSSTNARRWRSASTR